jgi:hypothetical protein
MRGRPKNLTSALVAQLGWAVFQTPAVALSSDVENNRVRALPVVTYIIRTSDT